MLARSRPAWKALPETSAVTDRLGRFEDAWPVALDALGKMQRKSRVPMGQEVS